ncbi:hypothetical protein [Sediminispirochaeta bajacaliforniensis]|uniref:hypothetical protein n=1 Tax=Sediminispirochaeta bajacaliforniensis TaxID=148 RepID=UPI000382305F|nr:hypothetical protein [Sediminispirochaeta bajacaliforniensis]
MKTARMVLCSTPLLATLLISGCVPLEEPSLFDLGDLAPPIFLGLSQPDDRTLSLEFSEAVTAKEGTVRITGSSGESVTVTQILDHKHTLDLTFVQPPEAGIRCTAELSVSDEAGNSLDLLVPFYGINPDLPAMLINEITTQGSSSSPDMVELRVCEAGNLAGALLCEGIDGDCIQEIVFPPIEALAGDFVIIHFKPQGIEEEINETDDPAASGGLKAHPQAWDLWVQGGSGLSGNNGVIALYTRPGGPAIDAFLYSNRTSESDSDYRGFGSSAVLRRAEAICEAGMWMAADGPVRPEDAVNPEPSTATRSMFRKPEEADTNSSVDWFIAPTGGASFGSANGNEVYEP